MANFSAMRLFAYSALAALVVLAAIVIFSILNGGPPKNLIVLLNDPDGKVGELEVSVGAQRQVLSKSHQATGVSSASEPLPPVFVMTDEEINKIFGDVIKGRPTLPASYTLYFEGDMSILASSQEQLQQIVAEIKRRPVSRVAIYGYASGVGNVVMNRGVALFRARAVSSALASRGIDNRNFTLESIVDTALGAPDPKAPAATGSRRVEVVIR